LKDLDELGIQPNIHPVLHKIQRDAIQSQIDVFTDELMEWEKSKVYSEEEAMEMARAIYEMRSTPHGFFVLWERLTR
jgi:hypothetical protein